MTKKSNPKHTTGPTVAPARSSKATDFPKYQYHPLANLLPMQSGEEQQAMRAVIRAHGKLDEPVWLYQGKILDGRNSYEAHRAEGVIPDFKDWEGEYETPLQFVYVRNVPRRAMTPSQKAAVAAEFLPRFEKEAKERQRQHGRTAPGKKTATLPKLFPGVGDKGEARELAAKMFHVNAKYVSDAKKLKEKDPNLYREVFAGSVKLQEALKKAGLKPLRDATAAPPATPKAPTDAAMPPARKSTSASANGLLRTPRSAQGDGNHADPPTDSVVPEGAPSETAAAVEVPAADSANQAPITLADLTALLDRATALLPALAILLDEEPKDGANPTKAAVKKLAGSLPPEQRKKYKRVLGDLSTVARDLFFGL